MAKILGGVKFQHFGGPLRPGFHTTTREPKRAHLRIPVFTKTTKIQREDTQRETTRAKMEREREKREKILGGPAVRKRAVTTQHHTTPHPVTPIEQIHDLKDLSEQTARQEEKKECRGRKCSMVIPKCAGNLKTRGNEIGHFAGFGFRGLAGLRVSSLRERPAWLGSRGKIGSDNSRAHVCPREWYAARFCYPSFADNGASTLVTRNASFNQTEPLPARECFES